MDYEWDVIAYVALLRAVNVGGTGKLPMDDLIAMCEVAGFRSVRTYIASGNVIFSSDKVEAHVKSALEKKLLAYAGKPVGVLVRTAKEMKDVVSRNPFPNAPSSKTVAIFLDQAPPHSALKEMTGQKVEQVKLGSREIYVHYGDGIGQSKLKIPAAKDGTARNMNTIKKLAELAARIEG